MKNKLILRPGDYIVYLGGLKIENVGEQIIEFEVPENYELYPYETVNKIEDHA